MVAALPPITQLTNFSVSPENRQRRRSNQNTSLRFLRRGDTVRRRLPVPARQSRNSTAKLFELPAEVRIARIARRRGDGLHESECRVVAVAGKSAHDLGDNLH